MVDELPFGNLDAIEPGFVDYLSGTKAGDQLGVCVNGVKVGGSPLRMEYDVRVYAVRIIVLVSICIVLIFVVQYKVLFGGNGNGAGGGAAGAGGGDGNGNGTAPGQNSMCIVCWSNPRNAAFSCGHVSCCHVCSPRLRTCPICRQNAPVKKRLRVYFP